MTEEQLRELGARRLEQLRIHFKMYPAEFARKIYIHNSAYYRFVTNKHILTTKMLFTICSELEVSSEYLLGISNHIEPIRLPTNPADTPTLSERVKELLEINQISQSDFCRIAGISRQNAYRFINIPDTGIRADMFLKICEAFKINPDWLLGLSDEKPERITSGKIVVRHKDKATSFTELPEVPEHYENEMYSRFLKMRAETDLNISDFEKAVSIPKGASYAYMYAHRQINSNAGREICKFTGISADYLYCLTDEMKPIKNPVYDKEEYPLFDRKIEELLEINDLSYAQAAKILGIQRMMIYHLVYRHTLSIKAPLIYKICKAFNISADWLLGLSPEMRLDGDES